MNIRQAHQLSSTHTAVRSTVDGGMFVWTQGKEPLYVTTDGRITSNIAAVHHLHFDDDWQPVAPVSGRQATGTPRYDLIASIQEQIKAGTYMTEAKLETAFRRLLGGL